MLNKIKGKLALINFKKVQFAEVKVTMKNIKDNFCVHSFFQHIFLYMIPLVQIYYFRAFSLNSTSPLALLSNFINFPLIIYGLAYFSVQLLFSVVDFINDVILEIFIENFNNKEYFLLGENFRKIIILTEIANIIIYFPLILILNRIFSYYFFRQIIDLTVFSDIVFYYQAISFFTLLFYSINKPLIHMLYCFNKVEILTLASLIKFLINSSLCKYFSMKDYYVLKGCALSDAIAEFSCFLFLLAMQHFKNPFPQAWTRITFDNFKVVDMIYLFDLKKFVCFLFLNRWNEIMILLYVTLNIYDKVVDSNTFHPKEILSLFNTIEVLVFLSFCKYLFFGNIYFTKRKTVMDLMNNLNNFIYTINKVQVKPLGNSFSKNKNNNLKENLIKDDLEIVGNSDNSLQIFKTKIISCLLMCLLLMILYMIFYFFDFPSFCYGEKINLLDYLTNSFNGVINSFTIELYIINIQYHNPNYFSSILIGFLAISFPLFLLVNYLGQSISCVLISLYIGEVFILRRFYSFIESVDVRIINVEKLIKFSENK